jgi:hypothetical protein
MPHHSDQASGELPRRRRTWPPGLDAAENWWARRWFHPIPAGFVVYSAWGADQREPDAQQAERIEQILRGLRGMDWTGP